jgi:hypothetical protein
VIVGKARNCDETIADAVLSASENCIGSHLRATDSSRAAKAALSERRTLVWPSCSSTASNRRELRRTATMACIGCSRLTYTRRSANPDAFSTTQVTTDTGLQDFHGAGPWTRRRAADLRRRTGGTVGDREHRPCQECCHCPRGLYEGEKCIRVSNLLFFISYLLLKTIDHSQLLSLAADTKSSCTGSNFSLRCSSARHWPVRCTTFLHPYRSRSLHSCPADRRDF